MDAAGSGVVVGGLVHESSTFMTEYLGQTGTAAFSCHQGADLLAEFAGTATVTGGYLAACEQAGVTPAPALHARAEPGSVVAPEAYRDLERRLLAALAEAGDRFGITLLDLHGAGVVWPTESLDVAVLRAVRSVLPDTRLVATMDLHGNVTDEIFELADVVVGYQEYPHVDADARARLAAEIAFAAEAGRVRPVTRHQRLGLLLPPSPTIPGAPAAELMELVRSLEKRPGVLACTVFHGFPYADTPQASASVVAIADGDPGLAEECCREVADWLHANRERFRIAPLSPRDAVRLALEPESGTAVIGDGTDNPGCGAAGDSTYLLSALLEVDEPTCFATLWDPEAVRAAAEAGLGAQVRLRLGGRHGWASGPPIDAVGTVLALTDGSVVHTAMRRGKRTEFGPSARIAIGRTDVIVSCERRQVFDPEIFRLHGVDPSRYRIVGVKSLHHFRAGFASITDRLLVADAPGPASRVIEQIPRTGPTADLWPVLARLRHVREAVLSRRSALRLTGPAPSDEDLLDLLEAASTAADHGRQSPWRLVLVRGDQRHVLGEAFAHGLTGADADRARGKPLRAPLLASIVFCPVDNPKVPEWEQLAATSSMVATLELLLHCAGWGAIWRTGNAVDSVPVRTVVGVAPGERLLGWLYIGTPDPSRLPPPREAFDVRGKVSTLP